MKTFYLIQGSSDGKTWQDSAFADGKEPYHKVKKAFDLLKESREIPPSENEWRLYNKYRFVNREVKDNVIEETK